MQAPNAEVLEYLKYLRDKNQNRASEIYTHNGKPQTANFCEQIAGYLNHVIYQIENGEIPDWK